MQTSDNMNSVFSYRGKIGERRIWKNTERNLEMNGGFPDSCLIDYKKYVCYGVKHSKSDAGALDMYIQYSTDHDDFDEDTAFACITLKGTPEACYTLTSTPWDNNVYTITFNK